MHLRHNYNHTFIEQYLEILKFNFSYILKGNVNKKNFDVFMNDWPNPLDSK